MQIRIARHTSRLDEIISFYRDGLGLPEIGSFVDHAGYDGIFLDLPTTQAHLEFTAGRGGTSPAPHEESLIVLYLGSAEAVRLVLERLDRLPVRAANPYWDAHGVTIEDPDGFRIVLVPSVWRQAATLTEPSAAV